MRRSFRGLGDHSRQPARSAGGHAHRRQRDRGTLNSGAKSAALSIFEGTKQRFFARCFVDEAPQPAPAIDTAIAEGQAVVVQLVSTAEAMLDRRLADLSNEEREALEIDLSPREYVIDYLAKSFPVRLMAVFTDENGNPRSEPMSDEHGAPVLCRSALAARDRMIEQLCALPPIATALDAIIERFGVDQVAEVTGRTRRLSSSATVVRNSNRVHRAPTSPKPRPSWTAQAHPGLFRRWGTGRSYHADLAARNQARRVHFLLEPGWRADAAIQGLGRTNRTNQASAPLFRPVTTDVRGERRFISTIARRLDSLGALTRGQRQTGGQNLFDPADNLESIYAKEALHRWFGLLFTGKLEAVSLGRFQELTGLRIEAPDGSMVDDLPSIQRWLNRILALPSPCRTRSSTSSWGWSKRASMPRGRLAHSISALRPSQSRSSRSCRTRCCARIRHRARPPICWNWKSPEP
jgi:hypothetical protein